MHSADACPAGVGGAGSDCSSLSCQAVALVLVKGGVGHGCFNNAMLHLLYVFSCNRVVGAFQKITC